MAGPLGPEHQLLKWQDSVTFPAGLGFFFFFFFKIVHCCGCLIIPLPCKQNWAGVWGTFPSSTHHHGRWSKWSGRYLRGPVSSSRAGMLNRRGKDSFSHFSPSEAPYVKGPILSIHTHLVICIWSVTVSSGQWFNAYKKGSQRILVSMHDFVRVGPLHLLNHEKPMNFPFLSISRPNALFPSKRVISF